MTDNEIIKALECCTEKHGNGTCRECPLYIRDGSCTAKLTGYALDLIKRQKSEIERLRRMVSQNEGVLPQYENLIKSEAIKEFAERLKKSAFECDVTFGYGREHFTEAVVVVEIDNLVKEMTEDKNDR